MKKNKIIIKINIILLLVLVLPLKIEAKKSYNFIKINGEDLNIETYINENVVQNEKIVICSYRCSEDNKEYCNNEKFSAIYYNHDNTNISGNWFIDANLSLKYIDENVMGTGAQVKTRNNYSFMWEEFGNTTPYSGIYFGQSSTNNKNESWKNVTEYKNLQNSFICPKYMYFDHSITDVYGKDNNMELCYANEKEQCKTRNEENKTIFGKANDLEYSFNKELNEVLDNVIVSIQGELPEDILNKFLLANPGYECSSLFEDYDSISLVNEIYDSEIIDYYNSKIQASVPSDSINRSFYNYENLNKLFEAKKSKNPSLNIQYNNMDLVKKYNEMKVSLSERIESSIKHCETKIDMSNQTNIDSQIVKEQLNLKIENLIPDYNKIEFTELNCDNIFAELADIIKTGYFIIELIAILLVVVLTIVDYAQVILTDNQDDMKKSNKKLTTRLIIVVVILLLPALINMILKMLHIQGFNSEKPLCVEIKNK